MGEKLPLSENTAMGETAQKGSAISVLGGFQDTATSAQQHQTSEQPLL